MSDLSKRVKKAKELTYKNNPYTPNLWSTRGSKGPDYGKKNYQVSLGYQKETIKIETPDRKEKKAIITFIADCQKDTGNGQPSDCHDCKFNGAVCKHSLGAIYRSFEQAKVKRLVRFFEKYESAVRMAFGGKVCKVRSANGPGVVWCVISDWPESKDNDMLQSEYLTKEDFLGAQEVSAKEQGILSAQKNIDLMRGSEDDEGID